MRFRGARKRARSRGIDVHFDRDIGIEPPEEWRAEIDQTAVPGGIFGEIVFFHKELKTLILADTIINLELDMIRQPWRFAAKLTGMYYPRGQILFGMRLPLLLQKRKTRAAVQKMLSWQPERIILSHGRWFDSTPVRLCNARSDGRSSPLRFARMRMSNLVTSLNFRSGSIASFWSSADDFRGRDASYLAPPAQIRTGPIRAYGLYGAFFVKEASRHFCGSFVIPFFCSTCAASILSPGALRSSPGNGHRHGPGASVVVTFERSRRGRCGAVTTTHRFRGSFGKRDPPRGPRDRTLRGYLVRENPSWLQLQRRQHVLPCCEPTN